SDGDKEKAKAEVEAALKDGETAIEKATDTKGVDDAVIAGKQKMDDIYNGLAAKNAENNQQAKDNAKQDVDNTTYLNKLYTSMNSVKKGDLANAAKALLPKTSAQKLSITLIGTVLLSLIAGIVTFAKKIKKN
ncbi:LPXTG cell wall anchor domain-containing protein, partial [Leuconostoc citreum]|uniref:LPXTG cell wall anchor domain-containing protein n=1 Tax=Leuconostoc citreum TaxID=33964 RepID=UPI0032DE70BD